VTGPPVDVVLSELYREAARAVRAGRFIGHDHDRERPVGRGNRVLASKMALGDLDEAEQAAGAVEVVSSDAFYRWLALDPGDGVDARSPVDVPASNAVPDVNLLIIH
jgi:hypothetical protein